MTGDFPWYILIAPSLTKIPVSAKIGLTYIEEGDSVSSPRPLVEIKRDLDSFVGSKVRLKANRGRNRIIEKEGILESTYPNLFVVKISERKVDRRVSYSYADVLTETVELFVYDHQDMEVRIAPANP